MKHVVISAMLIVGACFTADISDTPGVEAVSVAQDTQRPRRVAIQPNIVYIMADDLDAKLLDYMPWSRRYLANDGATVNNFLYTIPLCCPSRASILRGQYAHNTGVWTNGPGEVPGGYHAFWNNGLEGQTFATALHDSGYKTGLFGKYLNGYPLQAVLPETHVPVGWDDWFALVANPFEQYNYRVNNNGRVVQYGEKYLTDTLSRESRAFMAGATEPFMMMVTPTAPHAPFVPANRHKDEFIGLTYPRSPNFNEALIGDKPLWIREVPRMTAEQLSWVDPHFQNRVRSVQAIDEMVKAIVDDLAASGKLSNTYIILGTDNGFHLGEHRLMGSPGFLGWETSNNGGKNSGFEEDINVPLWIRGPGIAPGTRTDELIGNVDLAPTFVDMANALPQTYHDGRSFLPILQGQPVPWRSEYLLERGNSVRYAGLRTATMTYLENDGQAKELYDLPIDPYQLRNKSSTPAYYPVMGALARRTQELRQCAGPTCW